MTEASDNQIMLTIKGARAERGVSLSDFESFIDNFLAALRDYDRAGRGEPTRKSGHPDRRAEAVTAFRLGGFQTGSGLRRSSRSSSLLMTISCLLMMVRCRSRHSVRSPTISRPSARCPTPCWMR